MHEEYTWPTPTTTDEYIQMYATKTEKIRYIFQVMVRCIKDYFEVVSSQ